MTKTSLLGTNSTDIAQAANLLRSGHLVSFPTETVYGLGADATNGTAVANIFAAKGRPSFNPLIVHVADLRAARKIGTFDEIALKLAAAFWPGPLTIVVPVCQGAVDPLVTAGLDTVAIRVPAHPVAQALLAAADRPVAAPSANPSGQVSPTTARHVQTGLNGKVSAIVDGGPCAVGLESTIVSSRDGGTLLRAGGLPIDAIQACLGTEIHQNTTPTAVVAPGQLASHYAPQGLVRLNVTQPAKDEVYVGFGPIPCDINLSKSGDLTEAAANLFATLHELNTRDAAKIAIAPIPKTGLGVAINDRLARAAAPRD